MAPTVFFTEDDVLVDTGLYLFVEVRVVESDQKTVSPGLARYSYFAYDCFVVELVVEPSDVVYLVAVGVLGVWLKLT